MILQFILFSVYLSSSTSEFQYPCGMAIQLQCCGLLFPGIPITINYLINYLFMFLLAIINEKFRDYIYIYFLIIFCAAHGSVMHASLIALVWKMLCFDGGMHSTDALCVFVCIFNQLCWCKWSLNTIFSSYPVAGTCLWSFQEPYPHPSTQVCWSL